METSYKRREGGRGTSDGDRVGNEDQERDEFEELSSKSRSPISGLSTGLLGTFDRVSMKRSE